MADEAPSLEFKDVVKMPYTDQALFFLTAFWSDVGDKAEDVWKMWKDIEGLDAGGNELNEVSSHKFMEKQGFQMTAKEMREALAQVDLDFNGKMALIEYLLYHFKKKPDAMMAVPRRRIDPALEAAKEELNKITAENQAIDDEMTTLTEKIAQLEVDGKAVAKGRAEQELAALKNKDRTELNMKLSKAENSLKKAKAAYEAAGEDPNPAADWWMGKQMEEAKSYLPKSKQ